MNLLGRVISYFSPVQRSGESETSGSLSTRRADGVQKKKAPDARQDDVRRKRLIQAASRHLEQDVPRSKRRQSDQGQIDDVSEDDQLGIADSKNVPAFEVETSQPDEHEIDVDVENTSRVVEIEALELEPLEDIEGQASYGSDISNGTSEQWSIRALINHRRVDDDIEIRVDWDNGETTWEPERNIHLDAPDLLFKYWDDQGGRSPNPEDPDVFDIVAIRAHTKRRFLVEWTGYPPSENTWLPKKEVEATAGDVVKEYVERLRRED